MPDSFGPRGRWPARLLCPWNSPGENAGAGFQFLLWGSSQPGIEPRSPALQVGSLPLSDLGSSQLEGFP